MSRPTPCESRETRHDEPRCVRLPFEFGDIVYHRARAYQVAGIVDGFQALPGAVKTRVLWGNDMQHQMHYFFELSSDYEPPFKPEGK